MTAAAKAYERMKAASDRGAEEARVLADVAIRDGEAWNDRRLPEMGRVLTVALDEIDRLSAALARLEAVAETAEALENALREIHGAATEAKVATEKAWAAEGGEPMGPFYQTVCTAAHGFGEIIRASVAAAASAAQGNSQ